MSEKPPFGADTVDIAIEGENVVARCYACHPPEIIGTWREGVSLNLAIRALFQHQRQVVSNPEDKDQS